MKSKSATRYLPLELLDVLLTTSRPIIIKTTKETASIAKNAREIVVSFICCENVKLVDFPNIDYTIINVYEHISYDRTRYIGDIMYDKTADMFKANWLYTYTKDPPTIKKLSHDKMMLVLAFIKTLFNNKFPETLVYAFPQKCPRCNKWMLNIDSVHRGVGDQCYMHITTEDSLYKVFGKNYYKSLELTESTAEKEYYQQMELDLTNELISELNIDNSKEVRDVK